MSRVPGVRIDYKIPGIKQIQTVIARELASSIKKEIDKVLPDIKNSTQTEIRRAFENNTTYKALRRRNSQLNAALGDPLIPFGVDVVINYIVSSVKVSQLKNIKIDKEVTTGIRIEILGGSGNLVQELLQEPSLRKYIEYQDASPKAGKYNIPWLDWLLTKGDGAIIYDYRILYGNFEGVRNKLGQFISRTGQAIMVSQPGYRFTIPQQHSGTIRDNFITRTLSQTSLVNKINDNIESTLQKEFK